MTHPQTLCARSGSESDGKRPIDSARSGSVGLVMLCDVDLDAPDATRTHTVEVARGFAAEEMEVDLIARGPDPKIEGVRYHRGRGSETQKLRRIAAINLRAASVLWRRRGAATRLYVRHSWSNTPILIVGRILGYRVVTQVDDMPYGSGYNADVSPVVDYGKRLATMLMGRLAHGVVAVTAEIKGLLVTQFHVPAERIAALPNGVNTDFFRPLPRAEAIARAGLDPDCAYVVFSGRFQPWVDFDTMLGAFAIAARQRPDARLLLVGDGVERERVDREIDRLGIGDAVLVSGFVRDRAKIRDFMCAATVTLAAHRGEYVSHIGVSPTKLAEYFAVGRAVVAKDAPGLDDILRESGAGVTTPGPEAMAAAILDLLDPDKADALGAIGRRVAEERYTWRSVVRRTISLFGEPDQGRAAA
jgi:glycosyltransferase involved in cell wall biosynthesis